MLSRPTRRATPTAKEILALLDAALEAGMKSDIDQLALAVTTADKLLRGDAGQFCMADNHQLVAAMTSRIDQLDAIVDAYELTLEKSASLQTETSEHALQEIIRAKDAIWELRNDRIRTARLVDALAGQGASSSARSGYFSIQQAFSGLDRLEVRGRDSAGIHVLVSNHGLKPTDKNVKALLTNRSEDALFMSGSVRMTENAWSFVYKAAAEIGELGDNTRVMRNAVMADDLLRLMDALQLERVHLVGHSTGGAIGQHIALRAKERLASLVLSASWAGPTPLFLQTFHTRRDILINSGPLNYLMVGTLLATPTWYLHDRFKDTHSFFETRIAEFPGLEIELGRLNAVMSHDLRHRLSEIRVPTLVIGARDDQLTPSTMSEELAQRIADARLCLLREGGHFCPQTVTTEYNAAVLGFLREQRKANEGNETWRSTLQASRSR